MVSFEVRRQSSCTNRAYRGQLAVISGLPTSTVELPTVPVAKSSRLVAPLKALMLPKVSVPLPLASFDDPENISLWSSPPNLNWCLPCEYETLSTPERSSKSSSCPPLPPLPPNAAKPLTVSVGNAQFGPNNAPGVVTPEINPY